MNNAIPDHVIFTPISQNMKTGPMPITISQKKTCPPACPFLDNGCYSSSGPIQLHWTRVSNGGGISYPDFYQKIKGLYRGTIWRHNTAGDLQGANDKLDAKGLQAIVQANRGRNGFTYTHYPMISNPAARHNRAQVKKANSGGFTVNLSGNSVAHADKLKKLNVGPVVCIIPKDSPDSFISPGGNKVIRCPAQSKDDMNCLRCQLCAKPNRGCIVGFDSHGAGHKRVEAIAKGG